MPSEKSARRFQDILDNIERIEQATRLAPDQPWSDIGSISKVLRHQYDDVDPEVIWSILRRDLAPLKRSVQQVLAQLATDGSNQ